MPVNSYKLDEKTLKGQLPATTGQVIFVDSATGNSNGEGSSLRPFSTLDAAISKSGVSAGDVIAIMPGHAETISTAGGCALDVAGVKIFGLGEGNNRPTFTFSATDATMTISAANITLKNIITKPSIDSVVSPIVVSAAGCTVDIEHQDASSTVEAVRAVLTTAAADDFTCKVIYKGFTAGNAVVNAVRLVGANNASVDVDFYGVASTAVVEFLTTACTNVKVTGKFYVSGTTDLSKNVVDTVTGSTWSVEGFDAAAGASFSGGSGNAIAAGDLSAIASDITTVKGNVGGTDSATNVIGANNANNSFASASVVANLDGTVLERLEALMDPLGGYDPVLGFRVTKVSNLADGSGTDNLFTVTGRCLVTHLSGEVTTVIGGAATMKLRDTTNSIDLCAATTIDTDAVGTMYALPGLSAEILNGTGGTPVVGSIPNVTTPSGNARLIIGDAQAPLTIAHVLDAADTGAVTWVLYYKPLTATSSIAAAA